MAKRPAPTKANLFRAEKDLRFATEGCELLHQKRDVLVMELMSAVSQFGETELKLREQMTAALDLFAPVCAAMGGTRVGSLLAAGQPEMVLRIEGRGIMGLSLPRPSLASGGKPQFRGIIGTPPSADAAILRMGDAASRLVSYMEIMTTLWWLATEIEKTQKRINALENLFIPAARSTIHWIRSVLEENDREELFRRKLLKSRSG
jgi:V/A-type H+-transporting ATPase subunit D